MTPAPRDMPKGTRVWTCDGCGKRETWRKGWRWWCGVESWNAANRFDATSWWPAVACSDACEDVVLKKVGPTRPRKGVWRMGDRQALLADEWRNREDLARLQRATDEDRDHAGDPRP